MDNRLKLCFACSSGGHLFQLYMLQPFWEKHSRFWATFNKIDAVSLLKDERCVWVHHPTNRNLKNLLRNSILALKVLLREKPDIIISSGAAIAVPFFYLGKLFRSKTVYIEVFDRITSPTLTGKLVYPVTDLFIVQWDEQKDFYPKGINLGALL